MLELDSFCSFVAGLQFCSCLEKTGFLSATTLSAVGLSQVLLSPQPDTKSCSRDLWQDGVAATGLRL